MKPYFTQASFEDEMNINLWPMWTTKYYPVDKVLKMGNEFINTIINNAPISGTRTLLLVDIRNQYLTYGFNTSGETSPGRWHTDTPRDLDSLHHVYIVGENRIEFRDGGSLPKNHYVTYGPDAIHRGVEVHTEEFRLLVRIEEVNVVDLERNDTLGLKPFFPVIYPVGGYPVVISEEKYYSRLREKAHLNLGISRE